MAIASELKLDAFEDGFLVSNPSVGALSTFSQTEMVAFKLFASDPSDKQPVVRWFEQIGYNTGKAEKLTDVFIDRLERDGWMRTEPQPSEGQPLGVVYLTIIRDCNLSCAFCYQSLHQRQNRMMSVEQVAYVLDKIKGVNPNCSIIVTGGEPLMHPDIFEILDLIRDAGFPDAVMITNGTYLTAETAERLKSVENLSYVQVSIDGNTAETHGLTRGESSFATARQGLQELIDRDIPFKLSPTLHDGNMHEAFDLATLAVENGGWYTPNYLTRLPQDAVVDQRLAITPARAAIVQIETQNKISEVFGEDRIREVRERTKLRGLCSESDRTANGNFICVTGWGELDINWNGIVYPCHLLKDDSFILGNVFEDEFWDMFQVAVDKGIRTPSTEFSSCSGCHFVSTCGGGCRASALYDQAQQKYVDGDQQLCDVNFAGELQKRLPMGALQAARNMEAAGDVDVPKISVDGDVTATPANFSGLHTRLDRTP